MKLAVVLVLGVAVSARADDAPAPVKGLLADPAQLATWLRDRDPIVESNHAKVEAAHELGEQARVLPNPQLTFTAGGFVLGNTNSSDGSPGSQSPGLSLGQTTNYEIGVGELIELGKRGPRRHAADTRVREAGENSVGALGDRLNDATTALGKLTYAASKRDVAAANLDAAKKLRDNEKVRVDHQDLSPLEFARIELDTEELELALGKAEAELAGAIATCSATLYARCVAEGLDPQALDAGAPLPAALPETTTAVENRPVRIAQKLAHRFDFDGTVHLGKSRKRRRAHQLVGVLELLLQCALDLRGREARQDVDDMQARHRVFAIQATDQLGQVVFGGDLAQDAKQGRLLIGFLLVSGGQDLAHRKP